MKALLAVIVEVGVLDSSAIAQVSANQLLYFR
jgi:hypothetical protein